MRAGLWVRVFVLAAVVAAAGGVGLFAQDPAAPERPADVPPAAPSGKKAAPQKNKDNATESADDQPKWDPQKAEKDIQVGQYYMKKGDVDAAIDRFQDAIEAKPGYAVPFRYLGEAQERKGLKKPAIKSYQRYLDLYPKAEDAEKIKKRIEKLYQETEKEKKDIR
ncbi:MAG TPA: tetratricopeptide repeat protein [Candidatus Acidoferrum sp.]|jgi:tetratricopeptide (TPR) repeat protein